MSQDLGSGLNGIDLSGIDMSGSSDTSGVLSDVSNGAPDMSPSTPTGNGSGYFIDPSVQNQIFGTIQQGLQYAMQRDAVSMQLQRLPTAAQQGALAIKQTQLKNNNQLILLLGAGLLIFMMGKKG